MKRHDLSRDTSPDAARLQIKIWREMSSIQKAETVSAVSRSVQTMALAGIRQRHADASERECFLRWALLTLGEEAVLRAYPDAAALLQVYTPEDILLQKLRWYRLSDEISERQWRDVRGIVLVQSGDLDRDYLFRSAEVLGVSDLLEKALRTEEDLP